MEVESVICDSCGFPEDCTPAYISRVRQRFQGRWLCGLCVEAVKDEVLRSDRLITLEEALNRHIGFCSQFQSSSRGHIGETEHPIFAMGRVLRRNLDSPIHIRSNSSPFSLPEAHQARTSPPDRSENCFSPISG